MKVKKQLTVSFTPVDHEKSAHGIKNHFYPGTAILLLNHVLM